MYESNEGMVVIDGKKYKIYKQLNDIKNINNLNDITMIMKENIGKREIDIKRFDISVDKLNESKI